MCRWRAYPGAVRGGREVAVMAAALSGRLGPAVGPDEWDRLANGHFYSTDAWLSFTGAEPGAVSGAVARYRSGRLAGAVPVAELTASPMPLYRWNDLLSSYDLPLLAPGGLLVGPRQGYQTHFLVSEDQQAGPVVADLVEEVRGLHGGRSDRACVAMYVTTRDALAVRAAGVPAEPVLLGADAWLQVPPGGWPEWLDSMRKNRRSKIRKEARRFRDTGYRIVHMPLSECYQQLTVAAAATLAKYGAAGRPADYLPALRRYVDGMGGAARVAVCSLPASDPLAFCIYFVWGDTVFLRWAGFDYRRLVGAAEYFNLLYYDQIERAAQRGLRWIHAGIKSAEAKARRGARLRPLWLVDLTDASPLARAADRVRQHNMRGYQHYVADTQTEAALVDRESWQAFV